MVRVRTLRVLAVAILTGLSVPRAGLAEVGGIHVNITPFGGYREWANEANLDSKGLFGGKLGVMFGRYIGVEGYYSWMKSETKYGTGDSLFLPIPEPETPNAELDVQGYGVDLTLNLPLGSRVSPYIFGGWHEEKVTSEGPGVEHFLNGPEFGGGIKIRVGSRTSLVGEVRDQLWAFDASVPDPPGEDNRHNLVYSGGLQVSLGGEAADDADNDGVADSKDTCPNTPVGALVDVRGCPLDADRDNVPDGIDQCPNTPAGTQVDARGCSSDSDNDGVTDDKDFCPNTQANVQVDAQGCPIELTEREVELLDKGVITARDIHFQTAKWDILPESRPILDEIGKILIQWPQLRIEIGGHADARGSDAYNMDLTQKRAQSVLDYLLTNFPQIKRDQYTARGFGERAPVASNRTVEGMARNRRVEFKVLNTEELTKERERRRLLKRGE